ncbi:MAG: nucleotide exchange factor GrpE [Bacteroidetes bacterium]|nr:nucleotide exchange factor GrpE [Bacteroidota bacterium]
MTAEFENNPNPGDNSSAEYAFQEPQAGASATKEEPQAGAESTTKEEPQAGASATKEEPQAGASSEGTNEKQAEGTASTESASVESASPESASAESGGEIEEMQRKYLYLLSEFENFKRRSTRERLDLFKNASKDLLVDLLPVLDDFERGLAAMEQAKEVSAVKTGVDLVYQKFRGILQSRGLQPIAAVGEAFDTELHEAISQAPAANDATRNTVLVEVEKGYKLNEQVVRYAKVIVAV